MNSARDAIQVATNRKLNCGLVDIDLVAGFNLVCMQWIALVLLAKGLSETNVKRFTNMYKKATIRNIMEKLEVLLK